jgi:hypothetical protein
MKKKHLPDRKYIFEINKGKCEGIDEKLANEI